MNRAVATALFVASMLSALVGCQKTTATGPNEPATSASTSSTTSSAAPTPHGEPDQSCLMVNICSCNMGCASVPLSKSQLKVGAKTRVTKGALEGKDVQVIEVVDATGARVLALSDRASNMPCSLNVEKAMGYVCETSKSGPVPANACAKSCD